MEALDGHAIQERLQDLRLGMGGQLGGMVNEGGHFPEVCKKSFQAMVSDMQAGITPEFFARYRFRRAAGAVAAATRNRAAGWSTPLYAGPGDTHYRPIAWDEALDQARRQAARRRPDCAASSTPAAESSNEAGFLLQLFARAVRHELRQQLLVLLPPGQRRRTRRQRSAPAPARFSSKTSTTPTCTF